MPRGPRKHKLCDRMWRFIEPDEAGCWKWLGRKSKNGYGLFDPDTAGPYKRAHRVMYQLVVGPIPEGLHLHHNCFVRDCVNPAHLEPLTGAENTRRSAGTPRKKYVRTKAYERSAPLKTHCVRGHEFSAGSFRMRDATKRVCLACVRLRSAKSHQKRSGGNGVD